MMRKRCSRPSEQIIIFSRDWIVVVDLSWTFFKKETHFRTKISQNLPFRLMFWDRSAIIGETFSRTSGLLKRSVTLPLSSLRCTRLALSLTLTAFMEILHLTVLWPIQRPKGGPDTQKFVILMKPFQLRLYFNARIVWIGRNERETQRTECNDSGTRCQMYNFHVIKPANYYYVISSSLAVCLWLRNNPGLPLCQYFSWPLSGCKPTEARNICFQFPWSWFSHHFVDQTSA